MAASVHVVIRRPNHAEVLAACRSYLESRRFTLWADWDISDDTRRELAATWLAREITNVLEHVQ